MYWLWFSSVYKLAVSHLQHCWIYYHYTNLYSLGAGAIFVITFVQADQLKNTKFKADCFTCWPRGSPGLLIISCILSTHCWQMPASLHWNVTLRTRQRWRCVRTVVCIEKAEAFKVVISRLWNCRSFCEPPWYFFSGLTATISLSLTVWFSVSETRHW